jgi:hypothetical protein
VGMANVGSRAPAYPPFIVALRERGSTVIHGKRPRSGRGSDRFSDPEITFLTSPYSTATAIRLWHGTPPSLP